MASPDSTTRIAARTSIIESIRGFTLKGIRIDKEELKHKMIMPEYLRFAMRDAIKSKGAESGLDYANAANGNSNEAPEGPLVVFINSRSGGRHGPELKVRLQELMSEEQVPHFSLFLHGQTYISQNSNITFYVIRV